MFAQPPPLPPLERYKLFIGHAWDYRDEYDGLVSLLRPDEQFHWENLSIPRDKPLQPSAQLPKSYRYLVRQIDHRISQADCVLILAGMYVAHRGWIQSEIESAKEFGKSIIAVQPRGSERFPDAVMHAADQRVAWNRNSIISAIRSCTRMQPLGPPLPRLSYYLLNK